MNTANGQIMRYLSAHVLRNRSLRRRLIDIVETERRALAPELDIDLAQLYRLCYLANTRDRRYGFYYLAGGFLSIIAAFVFVRLTVSANPVARLSNLLIALLVFIVVSGMLFLHKSYGEQRSGTRQ